MLNLNGIFGEHAMLRRLAVMAILLAPFIPGNAAAQGRGYLGVRALGNPTPVRPLSAGYCTAMAPQNWRVIDIARESSAFTVTSPSGNMRASWGIVGVNGGQAAGYYGPQFRTPAAFTQFLIGSLFGSRVGARRGPQMPYGFQSLEWKTQNGFRGYAIFRVFPLPADPRGYILSFRIGGAPSNNARLLVPLAVSVAASIRCNTTLRPPPPNDFHPAKGAKCFGSECSEADAATRSFNSILGTGYVHDGAGNNYYVGLENWIENGPDGPGYYKKNGNDVTKLQPGLE